MDAATPEGTLDVVALEEATPSLFFARAGNPVSYETTLWSARAGRIAVVWLPIWALCVGHFQPSTSALVASAVYLCIWKATLRRAYADHTVTVWTVGATVPAIVGGVGGALVAAAI